MSDFDLKSWLVGYLMGRQIPAHGAKTPVAYLYNGERMPPLPEYDKEKYPYVWICFGMFAMHAYVSPVPCIVRPDSSGASGTGTTIAPEHGEVQVMIYEYSSTSDQSWRSPYSFTMQYYSKGGTLLPMWANFDVLTEDGALYLAASEPVPVYE